MGCISILMTFIYSTITDRNCEGGSDSDHRMMSANRSRNDGIRRFCSLYFLFAIRKKKLFFFHLQMKSGVLRGMVMVVLPALRTMVNINSSYNI